MKTILIGGESAVGKSTIMRKVLSYLGAGTPIKYKTFRGTYHPKNKVLLAGIYDGRIFDGTDQLSSICQKDTCDFLFRLAKDRPGILFLAEGDRYFRNDFLNGIQNAGFNNQFVFVSVADNIREKRHAERLIYTSQNAKTLKSRTTKYNRLMNELKPITVLRNDSHTDLHSNVDYLKTIIDTHLQEPTHSTGQIAPGETTPTMSSVSI